MKSQLRDLIASALYPIKSYTLPSVCERYGMSPGDSAEAFSSKTKYVMARLEKLSDARVLEIAKSVVADYPDDKLQTAIENLDRDGRLASDITRYNLAKALNHFNLGGSRDLLELLRSHFSSVDFEPAIDDPFQRLSDFLYQHAVMNDDLSNEEILDLVGFNSCSQAKLFQFLEDILHPRRRDEQEQEKCAGALNPVLRRDGYHLAVRGRVSGYPIYKVEETTATSKQPADELISKALVSFDESGVHANWQKALERRATDPEGAITAAKTLIETVCKHILDESGCVYGDNDDLPKLYALAAEQLNLAPNQHTEVVFKSILGNCQSVVGNLAAVRNKLGDSHGHGKRASKPLPRHAELAVNLAGSMSMFLISTWNARKSNP